MGPSCFLLLPLGRQGGAFVLSSPPLGEVGWGLHSFLLLPLGRQGGAFNPLIL